MASNAALTRVQRALRQNIVAVTIRSSRESLSSIVQRRVDIGSLCRESPIKYSLKVSKRDQ